MQIGAFYTHIWSVLGNVHTLLIRHRHLILEGHNDPPLGIYGAFQIILRDHTIWYNSYFIRTIDDNSFFFFCFLFYCPSHFNFSPQVNSTPK